jgi:endonuclease I
MKKFLSFTTFIWILCFSVFAQIPDGYYNTAIGKKKAELKNALHLKIKVATVLGYGGGSGKTWSGFAKTDVRPEDGSVWDMYSNKHRLFNGVLSVDSMNIEHSFPKSWWGGTETQAYKDLHHLNPSDGSANLRKSSYPMAVINDLVTFDNGVIKVGKSTIRGALIAAWEPNNEYKGDFARAYMYMVTAYEDYASLWQGDSETQLDNNTYPVFEKWTTDLLLNWSRQDPVSQKEINRNNEVYKIQGNRNPYIDYPQMSEYVWGNRITEPFSLNGIITYPYLSYPDNHDSIAFGKVYYQQTYNKTLSLKAVNLTGNLTLSISGLDAANFSLNKMSITKTEAETGLELNVQFKSQTIGNQNAQINISGGGITPIAVDLKANCTPEFVALPATNITQNSFTANWTASTNATGYALNVFALQPNGQINPTLLLEEDFTVALPNTWLKEGWTDNTLAGNIKLASGSNYGKITLPPLDLSGSTSILTVRAKQYSTDNGAKLTATLNGQTLTTWTTGVANQDFSITVPKSTTTSSIALSAIAGKRLYIDYVKVVAQMPILTAVSVQNFPKSIGNIFNYVVDGLESDSTYYYQVTPEGNNDLISNPIKVHTALVSSMHILQKSTLTYSITEGGVSIHNLTPESKLILMDLMGRELQTLNINSSEIIFKLPQKGLYLLQIQKHGICETFKIKL